MNYEQYVIQRDALVEQIRLKMEARKSHVRDQRLDDISGLCSLFYDILQTDRLTSDIHVDYIREFWKSIYQHQRRPSGYICVMVKSADGVIAEFPAFKDEHQRLIDKYYCAHECVARYINRIIDLGYLDLTVPELVKDPGVD
jgi:hypothetical protein